VVFYGSGYYGYKLQLFAYHYVATPVQLSGTVSVIRQIRVPHDGFTSRGPGGVRASHFLDVYIGLCSEWTISPTWEGPQRIMGSKVEMFSCSCILQEHGNLLMARFQVLTAASMKMISEVLGRAVSQKLTNILDVLPASVIRKIAIPTSQQHSRDSHILTNVNNPCPRSGIRAENQTQNHVRHRKVFFFLISKFRR
jgi:hypothetical protein